MTIDTAKPTNKHIPFVYISRLEQGTVILCIRTSACTKQCIMWNCCLTRDNERLEYFAKVWNWLKKRR